MCAINCVQSIVTNDKFNISFGRPKLYRTRHCFLHKCRVVVLGTKSIVFVLLGDGWCIFRPTQIRYTPLLTYTKSVYYTSNLLARDFKAAIWTCVHNAGPPSLSYSRGARPRNCHNLT